MANLPSGIGAVGPGTHQLPANIKMPPGGYAFLTGLLQGSGGASASRSAPAAKTKIGTNPYAPLNVAMPLLQRLGAAGPLNSMTVFDLMNLGAGLFVPSLNGSGPIGSQSIPFSAGLLAPAGPAVSGALARPPLPRSGGKGVMG